MRPLLLNEKTISNLVESDDTDIDVEPIIEIATYSEIDVFECYMKGSETKTVMRKVSNDWVNATQIFKIANFTKNKRTRILEREAKLIKHEKIQGGYGRFQGTWIPLDDAKMLVNKYEIQHPIINKILNYIIDPGNLPARRSKNSVLKRNPLNRHLVSPSSYKVTPTKRMLRTVLPSSSDSGRSISTPKSTGTYKYEEGDLKGLTKKATKTKPLQFSTLHEHNQHNTKSGHSISSDYFDPYLTRSLEMKSFRKKIFLPNSDTTKLSSKNNTMETMELEELPFPQYHFQEDSQPATPADDPDIGQISLKSLSIDEYQQLMLKVLSSENCLEEGYTLPAALYNPPADFDINLKIDKQGHSLLHWASAMGNLPLTKLLISLKCQILSYNNVGFNPLTKMIFYNNSYRAGNFKEILSLLRICVTAQDKNGRLPLHYLIELTVNKTKDQSIITHYIDLILEYLQSNDNDDISILKLTVNHQDSYGNTILHIAALNNNLKIYNKLLKIGCSEKLTNMNNETPLSIMEKQRDAPTPEIPEFLSLSFAIREATTGTPQILKSNIENNLDLRTLSIKRDFSSVEDKAYNSSVVTSNVEESKRTKINENGSTSCITEGTSKIDESLRELSQTPQMQPVFLKQLETEFLSTFSVKYDQTNETFGYLETPPIIAANDRHFNSDLRNNSYKMKMLSGMFFDNVVRMLDDSNTDLVSLREQINNMHKKIETTSKQVENIQGEAITMNPELASITDIELHNNNMRTKLESTKKKVMKILESKSKIKISEMTQNQKSKLNSISLDDTPNASVELINEYRILHRKREALLQNIIDAKAKLGATRKIIKYKKLLGTNSNNQSLDDVTKELINSLMG
ncbi:hypothetical protein TPHA_0K00750 [Tetrapisispora phaffii CBS 4417]|uniref:HTH APSES-type domain-containing protein n=1 Tax=Tetrapisispora phaffii (strain ATCC 24235 / CBS 4417 / NBRC 1672 / NRRL Y-8282 / UCD 70-5) TaxID=1071381 RepID=G8BZ81_TETPH|nr:hypothetical protein TPHA_0K00750 [Tetrapisispora phaffii CBS 4417]CCE65209.1 hypothetical protein TPHA_0K00750 [Tetrapisispora phaffii CBS 4417]